MPRSVRTCQNRARNVPALATGLDDSNRRTPRRVTLKARPTDPEYCAGYRAAPGNQRTHRRLALRRSRRGRLPGGLLDIDPLIRWRRRFRTRSDAVRAISELIVHKLIDSATRFVGTSRPRDPHRPLRRTLPHEHGTIGSARFARRSGRGLMRQGRPRARPRKPHRRADATRLRSRHSAACKATLDLARVGAPTRRRRSENDKAPPNIITTAPSHISSTSGLSYRRTTVAPSAAVSPSDR